MALPFNSTNLLKSGWLHPSAQLREQGREGGISYFPALWVLRHCIKVAWSLLGKGFAITHVRPSHIMFMDMIDWTLKLPFAQMIAQFLQAYCVPLIVQSFNNEVEISQDSLEIPSFFFHFSLFFLFSSFLGGLFIAHIIFILSLSLIHLPSGFKGDQKWDSQYSVNTPEVATWQTIHCCLGQWVMQNSGVREVHTGKRDAVHEASETNTRKNTLEHRLYFLYLLHTLLHLLLLSTQFHDTFWGQYTWTNLPDSAKPKISINYIGQMKTWTEF